MPFGRKKREEPIKETAYEVVGGATIRKTPSGYEISWHSPMLTTVVVNDEPRIEASVAYVRQEDVIRIKAPECRLRIVRENDMRRAVFSP